MDDFTALYEKLAPYVIADSLRASAYEELPLEIKGRLKASIARLYAFWGHGPLGEERISRYSGFSAHEKMSPASCALIACCAKNTRGEELIPALLPALMAGVGQVIPWFVVDEKSSLPQLSDEHLMVLELLGFESAFASSYEEFTKAVQLYLPLTSADRLVLLGNCFEADAFVASLLVKQGVPTQCFPQAQSLYASLVPRWYCNTSIFFQS